jgi:pilus assembly protein CpaF
MTGEPREEAEALIASDHVGVLPRKELVETLSHVCLEKFRSLGERAFGGGEEERRRIIRETISAWLSGRYSFGPTALKGLEDQVYLNLFGLMGIEKYLSDPAVTEVMINGPNEMFIERGGRIIKVEDVELSETEIRRLIERIFSPLNVQLDWLHPYADGYLSDGSRVHAVIPPISRYPSVTIRRHRESVFTPAELVESRFISQEGMAMLLLAVRGKANIVIAGGTGTGKTTLLNTLSLAIPPGERVVTIEERFEMNLASLDNLVSLQCRPPSAEGLGAVSIRDLVKQSLRMRPDRIIIGECRQEEVFDLLQALNTGHSGSLTTIHAESPIETLTRMVDLALLNPALSAAVTRADLTRQVMRVIDLIVFLRRYPPDGRRRVAEILEVVGGSDPRKLSEIKPLRFQGGREIRLIPYDESIYIYGLNPLFLYREDADVLEPVGVATPYLERKLREAARYSDGGKEYQDDLEGMGGGKG